MYGRHTSMLRAHAFQTRAEPDAFQVPTAADVSEQCMRRVGRVHRDEWHTAARMWSPMRSRTLFVANAPLMP
jgi:hypothetical protein